jgi:hypothetical protein
MRARRRGLHRIADRSRTATRDRRPAQRSAPGVHGGGVWRGHACDSRAISTGRQGDIAATTDNAGNTANDSQRDRGRSSKLVMPLPRDGSRAVQPRSTATIALRSVSSLVPDSLSEHQHASQRLVRHVRDEEVNKQSAGRSTAAKYSNGAAARRVHGCPPRPC